MRYFVLLLTALFSQHLFANESDDTSLFTVALMVNSKVEASRYDAAFIQFEQQNSEIQLNVKYYPDQPYKDNIEKWLKTEKFDLLYWQAGFNRLHDLVAQDLLADLTSVWEQEDLNNKFTKNLKALVNYQEKIIAIPFSYYHWGFFYNKALFNELGISPPLTIDDLILTCGAMKQKDIPAIGMGLKEPWPVLAWFTYLTLRSHGLEFYNGLLKGNISWQDPGVIQIMETWKKLLTQCSTTSEITSYDWRLPARSLLRNQVGLVLSGSFIMQLFGKEQAQNIGFFSFPSISKSIPLAEIAPVEVWIVPKKSENQNLSLNFIKLFLEVSSLSQFNQKSHYISPHIDSPQPKNSIMEQGVTVLQNASGLTPYFDRDAPHQIVVVAEKVFTDFIENKNIASALNKLEATRLRLQGAK